MALAPVFGSTLLLAFGITLVVAGLFGARFGAGKSRSVGFVLSLIGLLIVAVFWQLELGMQDEIVEKLEIFRNPKNHAQLKVHRLGGTMKGQWAFSLNFRDRIIFHWSADRQTAYLFDIGDHSIYE